jgi:uncharacterized protein
MQAQTTGQTALITGAARGIGRELTKLFAKDGYSLVLVDREENDLRQLETELTNQHGVQTTLLIKDLGNPNAPEEIYAETQGKGQIINILVNNAGFGVAGKFATETDLEREKGIIQVNATALMHLTKLFVKDMVARNEGKILMLGSVVSVNPSPMQAVYGGTKAFIKAFSESIREELKDTNIAVTVLMPGATNTHFFETAGAAHMRVADPKTTADPAAVAKEGYDALMSGKDHVVAGTMNKLRVAMAHILTARPHTRRPGQPGDGPARRERGRAEAATAANGIGSPRRGCRRSRWPVATKPEPQQLRRECLRRSPLPLQSREG